MKSLADKITSLSSPFHPFKTQKIYHYLNKVSEVSLTAGGGALATITSVQLAKQIKEQLLEIIEKSDE
ncbi:hypothetical protein [Nostoc sp. CCY 9925]|uniref:hypothetical protein n=1 Tax=Nostoc sp. CCY 9925 TaxID=3103865 RepID=UPI0039C742BC